MAGRKQFREDEVLDRVMQVFWERGYNGTSIQDLVEATGLKRGSLYNAYGNKDGLFVAGIERYRRRYAVNSTPPAGLPPREALVAIFTEVVRRLASRTQPSGCLLTNSIAELTVTPPTVRRAVLDGLAEERARYRALVEDGVRTGDLADDVDPDQLVQYLAALRQSLALLGRAGASRRVLREVADIGLRAWPETSNPPPT